jgi:hypothetical protein
MSIGSNPLYQLASVLPRLMSATLSRHSAFDPKQTFRAFDGA